MKTPITIVALIAFALTVFPAQAASRTWTGAGVTYHWSEGANWEGGIAPSPGDQLVFPTTAQIFSQNDIPGATFESMRFTGEYAGQAMAIYGLPVTLTSAWPLVGEDTTGAFYIATDLELAAPSPRISLSGNKPDFNLPVIAMYGNVVLNGGEATIESATTGQIVFYGDVSERSPTSMALSGNEVQFLNSNTISGVIDHHATYLTIHGGAALGTASAGTVVAEASHLFLWPGEAAETVIAEPLALNGHDPDRPWWGTLVPVKDGAHTFRWTGPVTLKDLAVIEPWADIAFDGPISGGGGLRVDLEDGTVTIGNPANSFRGIVSVERGRLRLSNSEVLPSWSTVLIGYSGAFEPGPFTATLTRLECWGRLAMTLGTGQLHVGYGGSDLGCALDLAIPPTFRPLSQQVVTLLRNDAGWKYAGSSFASLPEGSTINANGVEMHATYHAGAGNDFAYVAQALPAASLVVLWGSPQSVATGTASLAIGVRAIDSWGRQSPGARVTFSIPADCGTFGGASSVEVIADEQAIAISPTFTAGARSLVCSISAQGDLPGSGTTLVAYVYAPADVVLTAVPPTLSTIVNQPFNVGAELRGLNGMPLPGLGVTFERIVRGNAGVVTLPPSGFTDAASSRAVVTALANSKAGNYDIVIRFGGLSRTVPVSQKMQ